MIHWRLIALGGNSGRGREGSMNTGSVEVGGVVEVGSGIGKEGAVVPENDTVGRGNVGRAIDVAVGMALCVSASVVLMVDMAVSIISASLIVGVD